MLETSIDNPHIQRQIRQIVANWKLTPATFAQRISGGTWIPAKWLLYVSARIASAIARGNGRIIISAPPRHGKSKLASVYTPSWALERYPENNVMLSSYGADLSIGFGREVRDIFQDSQNKELLNTRIRRDSGRVAAFLTEAGGSMYSVGLGGPMTGRGAHVLLIDDYIKEVKEALSPTYRDYVWNWFITTAYTRLEPGGTCIIIATRWHTDDLIGRILREFPGQWEYIEIPAIAEEGDVLGRKVGEVLFEERYPLWRLHELKETLGTAWFQALYQQKPLDETTKLSDGQWLRLIQELPKAKDWRFLRVWDLAATQGGGDYTASTKMAYSRSLEQAVIMNVQRGQWGPQEVEEKVQLAATGDGPEVDIGVEQEPGSSGKALVNHYALNVLPAYKVIAIPATLKKVIRAQPFLAAAEAGHVKMLPGPWNNMFVKEFDSFPGQNDDMMDTASAAYTELSGKKVFTASWGRHRVSHTANSNRHKQAQTRAAAASVSFRIRGATFGRRRLGSTTQ